MTSSDGKHQHRPAHVPDEDRRKAEERVERRDQQPADGENQRGDGENRRADGETQRGDQRAGGKAADAQHAPEQRDQEHIEAPGAEMSPAEHVRELELDDHERAMQRRDREHPDVLLDIPIVKVDEISLNVEDLSAQVSVAAKVGNLVLLNVGAEVHLGHLNLTIKGVEAKALLKVYLENVYAVLARTLLTLDRNPELIASLGRTIEKTVPPLGQAVGNTVEKTVPELGRSVGSTVEKTVPEVGRSVGSTVEKTVPEVGKVAGGAREKSRVMQPIRRAVHRISSKTHRAVGGMGDLSRIPRRGAAVVRNMTRRLGRSALQR